MDASASIATPLELGVRREAAGRRCAEPQCDGKSARHDRDIHVPPGTRMGTGPKFSVRVWILRGGEAKDCRRSSNSDNDGLNSAGANA